MNFYANEHNYGLGSGFEPATSGSASAELSWQPLSQESEGPLSPSAKPVETSFIAPDQTGFSTAEDLLDSADHSTLKKMIMKLLNGTDLGDSWKVGVSGGVGGGVSMDDVGVDTDHYERSITSSSDLVIIQFVLLALLVTVSLLWAFCCNNRWDTQRTTRQISSMARKISGLSAKDLPPNYSRTNLDTVGLSIHDHYNPPPHYDQAIVSHGNPLHPSLVAQYQLRHGRVSVVSMGFESGGHNPLQGGNTAASIPANSRVLMVNPAASHAPISASFPPRRISSQSLPLQLASPELATVAEEPAPRKISVVSAGAPGSRKVSFVDAETGRSVAEIDLEGEADLEARIASAIEQGELDFFYESETGSETGSGNDSRVPRRK